jgi:glutathione S-transferase
MLSQSNAILNYIGAVHGLRPNDPWEAAQHDLVMEAVEEIRGKIWVELRSGSNDEEKKAARHKMADTLIANWAREVEHFIAGPFVRGDRVQVADLKVWSLCQWLTGGVIDHLPQDVLTPFKKLSGVHQAVAADERVAAFRKKHAK